MKFIFVGFLCLFFTHFFSYSQITDYAVSTIPDSLEVGANAVVRYCKQEIDIDSEKSMTITLSKIITVLNEEGDRHVDAYKHYSNDSKIKKISAVLYNAMGLEIVKYKKKDFNDVSAVSGFYSDDRLKYLDFTPREYPYTLKFEYVFKTNTTLFLPIWYPVHDYNLAIEYKEIIINNLSKIPLHHKELNFNHFEGIQNISIGNISNYKIENRKAIKKESFSPYFTKIYPLVKFYLEKFVVRGYKSDRITGWKDYGKWQRETLYGGRSDLSDETKNKIINLVKDEDNPLKKAKLVYEYMQNKTRYVYVGIGIGGLQPTKASEVDRLGYGDCKGLSNYTKALLGVIGIKADCVVVYADEKIDFDSEYHGKEGNHIILNLPKLNKGKDVWLECTSQTLPFGFLGDFTDDRDVLVLEKEGGTIKHTPKYLEENNQQITTGTVAIDVQGNVKADITMNFTGIQYGNQYYKERLTPKELQKYYKSNRWSYIDNLKVEEHHLVNHKEQVSFVEDLKIKVDNYASVLREEIILRLNVFNKNQFKISKKKKRKNDIYIRNGFLDVDDIEVNIPEGYDFNQKIKKKNIETKFGNYAISILKEGDRKIRYKRKFLLKEGLYPKEEYKEFSKFIRQVNSNDNLKIVFNKK